MDFAQHIMMGATGQYIQLFGVHAFLFALHRSKPHDAFTTAAK